MITLPFAFLQFLSAHSFVLLALIGVVSVFRKIFYNQMELISFTHGSKICVLASLTLTGSQFSLLNAFVSCFVSFIAEWSPSSLSHTHVAMIRVCQRHTAGAVRSSILFFNRQDSLLARFLFFFSTCHFKIVEIYRLMDEYKCYQSLTTDVLLKCFLTANLSVSPFLPKALIDDFFFFNYFHFLY